MTKQRIVPVRMKLEAQMKATWRPQVLAGGARSAAESFPRSAIVWKVLAQAELQAKHYAEASVAADKAIALNPKSFKALIYKGRARARAGEEEPKSANWSAIRAMVLEGQPARPQRARAANVLLREL